MFLKLAHLIERIVILYAHLCPSEVGLYHVGEKELFYLGDDEVPVVLAESPGSRLTRQMSCPVYQVTIEKGIKPMWVRSLALLGSPLSWKRLLAGKADGVCYFSEGPLDDSAAAADLLAGVASKNEAYARMSLLLTPSTLVPWHPSIEASLKRKLLLKTMKPWLSSHDCNAVQHEQRQN